MIEYLSNDEARYLIGLTLGQHAADFWSDTARQRLGEKLNRLAAWALKEDEARRALRQRADKAKR